MWRRFRVESDIMSLLTIFSISSGRVVRMTMLKDCLSLDLSALYFGWTSFFSLCWFALQEVHLSFSSWWAGQTLLHLMHFLVGSCKSARTHHPPRFVQYLASSQEEFGVRTHRILRSEASKITSVSCRPRLVEKTFNISHYMEKSRKFFRRS